MKRLLIIFLIIALAITITACSRQEKKTAAEWAVQFCLEDIMAVSPIGVYTTSVETTHFETDENLNGIFAYNFVVTIIDYEYDSHEFDMGKYTYYCFMFTPDNRSLFVESFDNFYGKSRQCFTREEAIYDFGFMKTFEGIKGETTNIYP